MLSRVVRAASPVLLLLALVPAHVVAAEVPSQTDVQVWLGAEPGQVVVVVGQILDPSTELPATVRLPLPPGAQVVWAGEILETGGGAQDPAREYEVVPGTGGDVVEFTATESRNVQIETIAGPVERDGDQVSASVLWMQSEPASVTAMSVRMPPGAADVEITPPSGGPPDSNEIGETLYALPLQRLAPGQSSEIAVTYRDSAGAGAAPSGTQASTLLPWLIGAFLVAVGALAFLLFSQRASGSAGAESEDGVAHASATLPSEPADNEDEPEYEGPEVLDDDDEAFIVDD
jgi:hypothetical protein